MYCSSGWHFPSEEAPKREPSILSLITPLEVIFTINKDHCETNEATRELRSLHQTKQTTCLAGVRSQTPPVGDLLLRRTMPGAAALPLPPPATLGVVRRATITPCPAVPTTGTVLLRTLRRSKRPISPRGESHFAVHPCSCILTLSQALLSPPPLPMVQMARWNLAARQMTNVSTAESKGMYHA